MLDGRIQTRNWVDKQGVKKFKTEIVMETLQLPNKQTISKDTDDFSIELSEINL
jgi:single-stranded DNA-binding protein